MTIRALEKPSLPAIPQPRAGLLSSRRRQKGAAALEYLMLAAAMVAILGVFSANGTIRDKVTTAFTNVFNQATETVTTEDE